MPSFRKDRYADGIADGTKAIIKEFAGLRIGLPWTQIVLVLVAAALVPVSISLFRHGKRGWGWVVAGVVIVLIVFAFKTSWKVVEALPSRSGPGGFGGGFSGGGGATGSW